MFMCDSIDAGVNYRSEISMYVVLPLISHAFIKSFITLTSASPFFYLLAISRNASSCLAMVPFMNKAWCSSKECEFEFNIALRNSLTNYGTPFIIPLLLENLSVYKMYPLSSSSSPPSLLLLLLLFIYLFCLFDTKKISSDKWLSMFNKRHLSK